MLEHPIGAALWSFQTSCDTITGRIDAVAVEEVDHGDDARDVDAWEVADAATVVGGSGELGELVLGDFAAADGVVVVSVAGREDVDVGVVVVVLVAGAETEVGGS